MILFMKTVSFTATIVLEYEPKGEQWTVNDIPIYDMTQEKIKKLFESNNIELGSFSNNFLNKEWHPVIVVKEVVEEAKANE